VLNDYLLHSTCTGYNVTVPDDTVVVHTGLHCIWCWYCVWWDKCNGLKWYKWLI